MGVPGTVRSRSSVKVFSGFLMFSCAPRTLAGASTAERSCAFTVALGSAKPTSATATAILRAAILIMASPRRGFSRLTYEDVQPNPHAALWSLGAPCCGTSWYYTSPRFLRIPANAGRLFSWLLLRTLPHTGRRKVAAPAEPECRIGGGAIQLCPSHRSRGGFSCRDVPGAVRLRVA